jgi:hypothetical protein
MDYKTDEKSGGESYFASGLADEASPDYFLMGDTANYFPNLRLIDEYLPIGSGKEMCLHIEWIKK